MLTPSKKNVVSLIKNIINTNDLNYNLSSFKFDYGKNNYNICIPASLPLMASENLFSCYYDIKLSSDNNAFIVTQVF